MPEKFDCRTTLEWFACYYYDDDDRSVFVSITHWPSGNWWVNVWGYQTILFSRSLHIEIYFFKKRMKFIHQGEQRWWEQKERTREKERKKEI